MDRRRLVAINPAKQEPSSGLTHCDGIWSYDSEPTCRQVGMY